jgi:hypothetical protein
MMRWGFLSAFFRFVRSCALPNSLPRTVKRRYPLCLHTNSISKLPFASTILPGEFTLNPTPVPLCLKSRVSLRSHCLRRGQVVGSASELPALNTSSGAQPDERFAINGFVMAGP